MEENLNEYYASQCCDNVIRYINNLRVFRQMNNPVYKYSQYK